MPEYDSIPPVFYDSGICYDTASPAGLAIRRKMKRIKLAPSQMTEEGVETFSEGVVERTDGKPAYLAIQPKVTLLAARVASYHTKRLAVESARVALAAAEDTFADERDLLELDLGSVANAVESEAKGSLVYITDAGFSVTTEKKQALGQLPPPQNLTVKPGALEGTLKLRCRAVHGAKSYIFEMATNAAGPWKQIGVSPRASFTAEGLTSGTKYWFRVQVVGASGPSGWSGDEGGMAP